MTSKTLCIEELTATAMIDGQRRVLVDNLSLTVQRGRVLALVGASGSGKSMTCSAALGVMPPGVTMMHGRVTIDGQAYNAATLRGRHVATIMQNPRSAFNPVRTMRDHAVETLRALGKQNSDAGDRIEHSMRAAGLDDIKTILGLHAFEMSGGMLQRMMIALALLSEAPFLFADEPTTDLDLVVQLRVLELIEKLAEERGMGVLLITHDMGVVARLADDVAVIDHGRLVEQASVMDIFHRPQHHVTRTLVSAHLSLYGMEPST
ncbi:nickel import ATP-binding protein NikD [Agrobacterium tumefaciens]|uniref:nickel import ATP-binding protein NikD n=1 Tax=Agrobacterium tumefaciens TaxID=358 RepID=UPI00287BE8DE|nr:nickel import ATP-binding protein NikD [Agrobacterium tumefaciens]MDS7596989.1 nickel import ATP-binding protein NikD [Agrobacterium tumefaciens]